MIIKYKVGNMYGTDSNIKEKNTIIRIINNIQILKFKIRKFVSLPVKSEL